VVDSPQNCISAGTPQQNESLPCNRSRVADRYKEQGNPYGLLILLLESPEKGEQPPPLPGLSPW
jgi:hypothetical protein